MSETLNPRNFNDLDKIEKIRAVLAYSRSPISPGLAVDIAGIDRDELTEEDAAKIFAVFEEEGVRKTGTKTYQTPKGQVERDEYEANEQYKDKVWKSVNKDSVTSVFVAFFEDALKEMGFDDE